MCPQALASSVWYCTLSSPSLPVASVPPPSLLSSPSLQLSSFLPMALSSYGQFFLAIKKLAKPASSDTPPWDSQAFQTIEVAKQVLLTKAASLVGSAQGLPILRSFSSDGTPVSTKLHHHLSGLPSTSAKSRAGTATPEYQVQTCFYRYFDYHGSAHSACVIRDPLPLTHGKSALAIFANYLKFNSCLRDMGHIGIAIEHHVEDRACFSALDSLHERSFMSTASKYGNEPDSVLSPAILELMLWQIGTPCAAHDIHNGLKWSMHAHFNDLELMKRAHLATLGIRRAFDLLLKYCSWWVMKVADYTQDWEYPEKSLLFKL